MIMNKQITILMSDDLYILIVKEAGKEQYESGEYCSVSKIVNKIFFPAAEQYFKMDSENVSSLSVETISEDNSQNETQDELQSKQTVSAWENLDV